MLENDVLAYVRSHFRGDQLVGWSFLVNGIMAYLFAFAVAVLLDKLTQDHGNELFWKIWPPAFLGFVLWSWIGIVRAALRTLRDKNERIVAKAGSAAIMLLFLAAAFDVASNLAAFR
jgi:hypothetical protein